MLGGLVSLHPLSLAPLDGVTQDYFYSSRIIQGGQGKYNDICQVARILAYKISPMETRL
jgi:hypothetical protein